MKMRVRMVVGLLAVFMVLSCSTSPTGRSQLIFVPDVEMEQIGVASFARMKQQSPPSADQKSIAYVNCVSRPLLQAAGENPQAWEIQVFRDDSPNAFALPGRKIGVHTGMIRLAANADQLAAVIGHEIGHVQARHGAERLSMTVSSQVIQQIAAVGLGSNENSQLIMTALGLGAQFGVLLPYSRTHESEADYIGLMLMAKAGFDPAQSVELWQNMARAGGGQVPQFMSTHPSDLTRIRELGAKMGKANVAYQQALQKGLATGQCLKP